MVETRGRRGKGGVCGVRRTCLIVFTALMIIWVGSVLLWKRAYLERIPHMRHPSQSVRGGRERGFRGAAFSEGPWADPYAPVVAFVISVTSLTPPGPSSMLDAAEVLLGSIRKACSRSAYRCKTVALILPSVDQDGRRYLQDIGWTIVEKELPVAVKDIENETYRDHVVNSGCCGADEFLKLQAYTLTDYHRVVHLDVDTLILHPVAEIMETDASLMYTTDPAMAIKGDNIMPWQGGFLVIKPDLDVYRQLQGVIRKGDWRKGLGWGGSGIGWFYGGATIQGLLPYFYQTFAPDTAIELDRCIYNHMYDSDECRSSRYSPFESREAGREESEVSSDNDQRPIKSVHFTQQCPKPWLCYPMPLDQRTGHCWWLQQAWWKERNAVLAERGLYSQVACVHRHYVPITRD